MGILDAFKIFAAVAAVKGSLVTAPPGALVPAPPIKGIKLFGRRVVWLNSFRVE